MQEFLRRGGDDPAGLDDLARRVAERRRELLQRHHLDGTLSEVKELLDKAVVEARQPLDLDAMMDADARPLPGTRTADQPDTPTGAWTDAADSPRRSREPRSA